MEEVQLFVDKEVRNSFFREREKYISCLSKENELKPERKNKRKFFSIIFPPRKTLVPPTV